MVILKLRYIIVIQEVT